MVGDASRTVTYRFRGDFASLTAGLAASGRAVGDLGTKLTAADRKGAQYRRGLSTLGSTAGKMGLVAAAGIAVMVKATADFDQAMSNVNATGQATTAQLGELRKAALQAGQTTKFSATEAASGIEALLKAGVSASDVIGGGLKGSLSLAAAGEIDVGAAAEDAATAMTQFKLAGSQIPHLADLLAAGAGKAQGDVSDLAEALKAGGLTASQFGVSIDDTVGTLTAFAAAGLLGSTSGTVMKQMLLKLAAPSVKAAKTMSDLGISAYDASGKFVGFTALAGELQSKLSGLTGEQRNAALATIFGSRAIQGANVLYADGAQGIADWTGKVNDQGYAAEVAGKRLDNLSGDLHKFSSALQTAFIGQGEGTQGPLRNIVQGATAATNAFNKMPTSVHTAANSLLTITAVLGGGLWFTSKTIAGIGNMNSALKNLGISSQVTAANLKKAALAFVALEAAGQGINALIQATRESLPGTQELTKELLALTNEVQSMSNTIGAAQLDSKFNDIGTSIARISDKSFEQSFNDTASSISNVATSIIGLHTQAGSLSRAKDEISALDAALANIATSGSAQQAQAAFDALAKSQGLSKDQQAQLLKLMPQYQEALAGTSNTASLAAGAVEGLASSAQDNASAQDKQTAAINKANQAMKKQRDDALAAFDAETQYRQAVKDATAQGKKSDAGIRGSSDAALKNRDMLSRLAAAWNNQSAAVKNNIGRFNDAKKTFIDTATAMGVPKKAAEELAQTYLDIPRSVVSKISAETAAAHTAINGVIYDLSRLHDKSVTVKVNTVRTGAGGQGGGGYAQASGGPAGSGRISARPFPANARRFARGGLAGDKPLFTSEGPRYYKAAYKHNSPYAKPNPFDKNWPYQTPLTRAQETAFEQWVKAWSIPFQPGSHLTDYDMRGFWLKKHPKSWTEGQHFPDTFKTPYDTTFSGESRYATKNNPFVWRGQYLVDTSKKPGQPGYVVFAPPPGGEQRVARAGGGSIYGPGGPTDDMIPAWLSNGEYVVRAAAVDRYGTQFFDHINAMGFASGGHAGGKGNNTAALGSGQVWLDFVKGVDSAATSLASLKVESDAVSKQFDKAKSTLASDTAARDSLASTLSGTLGIDSAFSKSSSNSWAAGAGGYNVTSNLNQITATATAFLSDIKTLQANGVRGAALQAIISQGPELTHAMAQMPASALSAEVSAYSAATAAVAAVSSYGANAIDGAAITRDQKHLDQIRDEVKKLRHEMAQYAKDNKKGHAGTAHAAATSGTNASSQARRRAKAGAH